MDGRFSSPLGTKAFGGAAGCSMLTADRSTPNDLKLVASARSVNGVHTQTHLMTDLTDYPSDSVLVLNQHTLGLCCRPWLSASWTASTFALHPLVLAIGLRTEMDPETEWVQHIPAATYGQHSSSFLPRHDVRWEAALIFSSLSLWIVPGLEYVDYPASPVVL